MNNLTAALFFVIMFFFACASIVAQEFLVTDIIPTPYSKPYSIDPITNDIYIVDIVNDIY